MSPKRYIVVIDGSNFYYKLKDLKLHNLLNFNLSQFIIKLIGKGKLISCTYYIGKIRTDGTKKTQQLFNRQRKLFSHLRKNNIRYSLGYLLKTNDNFHEKGVDVNMAVDMLVEAYENLCDNIILISSDTDLLPVIKKARLKGLKIEYIGFSHKPSLAMIANCSNYNLIKKEDLLPFVFSDPGSE